MRQKILRVFEIQTDHLIPNIKPNLVIINKKCHPSELLSENQRKRIARQVLGSSQITKKAMEQNGHGDSNGNWHIWNDPQRNGKGAERVRNWRTLLRSARIL